MTEFQALHERWLNEEPAYAAEYRAMESEFAIAAQRIRAHRPRPATGIRHTRPSFWSDRNQAR